RRSYYRKDLVFRDGTKTTEKALDSGGSSLPVLPPNDILARLVDPERHHPHYSRRQIRRAPYVHRADNWSTLPSITLTQYPVRGYVPFPEAWIDLVNDPLEDYPQTQRLRLRIGTRQLKSEVKDLLQSGHPLETPLCPTTLEDDLEAWRAEDEEIELLYN